MLPESVTFRQKIAFQADVKISLTLFLYTDTSRKGRGN